MGWQVIFKSYKGESLALFPLCIHVPTQNFLPCLFLAALEGSTVILLWEMLRPQYFYNIFTTNYRWLVIISSNLNLTLRLLFYPNSNNLPLKICCKNVVDISFLFFFPYFFCFVLISFFFLCSYTATPHLFFDFLKATRILKKLSPSFIPISPTPKEINALNSSLPLTPTSPVATRVSFNSSQALVPNLKLEWF